MWLRPDQQKVHNMLTEAIMMLCRNGLDYSQEFAVEGLLGITLDRKEVFLVNIKEVVSTSSTQAYPGGSTSKQLSTPAEPVADPSQTHASGFFGEALFDSAPRGARGNSPDEPNQNYHQEDHHPYRRDQKDHSPHGQDHSDPSEGIMTCPLTPMMHPFKSPFRRQRGRRKFFGPGPEGRGMGRKFGFRHQRMMHAILEAQKHMAPDHMTTFGMPFAKRHHIDDDTPAPAAASSTVTSSEPETSTLKAGNQSAETINENNIEPRVKVEPANSVFPSELTIDESTSLRFGNDPVCEEFGGSSPSTRDGSPWPYQEDSLQQPNTPSSVDTADTLTESFDDMAGPSIDNSIISRVKSAILKEDGCFVTTRMLCRRYSAYFKSHIVVEAMRAITVSMEDPKHIGIFCNMKERSKVFYKCPPNKISPDVLKSFNVTPQDYADVYYRIPNPKGMHTPRWEAFVQYILENSPYGPIKVTDFTKSLTEHDEPEPSNSMDEFELQHLIVHSDGCFISSRILCRRLTKQYKVINVIRAMKAMTRRRGDKHYIGQFVKASERIKIFFKAPPRLVGSEALSLYGVTLEQYKQTYYGSPRPWDGSVSNWDSYMENVASRYPYPFEDFPLSSCDVSPDVADRIHSMIGSSTSAFTSQMASFSDRNGGQKLYAAGVSSTATIDKLRSMFSAPRATAFPGQSSADDPEQQNKEASAEGGPTENPEPSGSQEGPE